MSGQKAEARYVAKDFKTLRGSTGKKKVFKPHEWLNTDTISGIFSRFTTQDTMDGSKKSKGKNKTSNEKEQEKDKQVEENENTDIHEVDHEEMENDPGFIAALDMIEREHIKSAVFDCF